jgi:dolichyl-phosphate-mannose--protein O-mannosyl transferase
MTISWIRLCLNWVNTTIITKEFFIFSFILLGYFCNLLPWIIIDRCTFIYHYQPAAIFGFLALAWYLGTWLDTKELHKIIASWLILLCIMVAFLYWLPIQLGIPMENFQFYDRMKLESWI